MDTVSVSSPFGGGGSVLSEHVAEKHRIGLADTLLWVYLEFQGMGSLKESIPSVTAYITGLHC